MSNEINTPNVESTSKVHEPTIVTQAPSQQMITIHLPMNEVAGMMRLLELARRGHLNRDQCHRLNRSDWMTKTRTALIDAVREQHIS